ncbi:MAG: NfeD family protein [Rubrivivax sp.]|nr:NfeD family protein [Rubrivivax sp.]MBK8529175.1 NfeD family protein [Rubrivivax sp.]
MDWTAATGWWIAAGMLVAIELLTGTFYLLMLALGCVAAALAAHAGGGTVLQIAVAALVGAGATAGWHLKRARAPRSAPSERNRDVNLDIGERVQVRAWSADGSTQVFHRGANWTARLAPGAAPTSGAHVIVALNGNQLELAPAPAAAP